MTAPFFGIGSGRTTSNAEIRSVTTNSSVSPRSKTSRTFPLRSFLIPGRLTNDCGAICMGKRLTLNAQFSTVESRISSLSAYSRILSELDVQHWALDVELLLWLESLCNSGREFYTE